MQTNSTATAEAAEIGARTDTALIDRASSFSAPLPVQSMTPRPYGMPPM